MTAQQPTKDGAGRDTIVLSLPFTGTWLVQNSPARRVPSHGTDLLGESHAIDFVGADDRGRTAGKRTWQTVLGTEPPERFFSFGRPILAPCDATVVGRHDGEPDHDARRSAVTLLPYLLGQRGRLNQGIPAIAGNHLVLELPDRRGYVALVHLRRESIRVSIGDQVGRGQHLADCGNSGNSTQPHVHVQAMDNLDLALARGIPIAFRDFRERSVARGAFQFRDIGIPGEGSVVEPGGDRPGS